MYYLREPKRKAELLSSVSFVHVTVILLPIAQY
jgi:hypothetical protein